MGEKLSREDIKGFEKVGYELLDDLREAKESGSQHHAKEAQDKIDKYRSYLFNEYGIKAVISKDDKNISLHKLYRPGKESENMRQVVKNQLKNATKDFVGCRSPNPISSTA